MAQNFNTVNIGYNFMHFSIRKKGITKTFVSTNKTVQLFKEKHIYNCFSKFSCWLTMFSMYKHGYEGKTIKIVFKSNGNSEYSIFDVILYEYMIIENL